LAAQDTAELILRMEGSRGKPDNATLAAAHHKLGAAQVKCGKDTEALAAFEQAIELSEKAFGPDRVETANILSELGSLYSSQGNHAEAQRCLRRTVEIHRTLSGVDSAQTTQSLFQLASSLSEAGDHDSACGEFERVLTIKERQLGANPDEIIEAQLNLALLYLEADRTSAARELLLPTVGKLERKGGERLVTALKLLVEAEQGAGRSAEAARWRQKLETMGQPAARPDLLAQFGRASVSY
jgi:tetratricopeptide (TPR) repeat protein